MKIKCMLDDVEYDKKPQGKEIGVLQNRLVNAKTEITIENLANKLVSGATFRPAFLIGKKDDDFVSQQLFALDFDDETTIEEEVNRCKTLGIYPCFGYTSFSHKEDHHKFRLVFCSNKIITDINMAKQIQLTLMSIFKNCDIMCKNPSRLYFGGKELIYKGFDNMIDVETILRKYSNVIDDNIVNTNKDKDNINYILYPKTQNNTNLNIEAIKSLNVKVMKSLVDVTKLYNKINSLRKSGKIEEYYNNILLSFHQNSKLIAINRFEIYSIINMIDMADFLGIDNKSGFCCIIHEDHNPSAGIFTGRDGSDIYKCHSSKCNFIGGLIKIVEKLARCNKPKAINFIKEVYNIELQQTDWQKEQIELLETNKEYLYSGKMEDEYPELWKYIKPRLNKLININDLAIKNCYDESMSIDELPLFWASTTYLKNVFGTNSMETVNKSINLFTLLDILMKVEMENIPVDMLNKAKHHIAKKGYKKLPNHFCIPSYDVNTLEESENKAQILKNNNFSMKGLSREWVIRTFGLGLADKIYPQYKYENKKGNTKKSDERTFDIVRIIVYFIDLQGYCMESDVVELLKEKHGKEKIRTQLKKSMQEILDTYGLERIRATKKIKEQYNLDTKGYPFLIVKKHM